MAYADEISRRIGCVILLVVGFGLVAFWLDWLDEPPYHDATGSELAQVAAKCGAIVKRFGPTAHTKDDPSVVSVTIHSQSDEEFVTKATCIDRELKELGAFSHIYGPDGNDLLVSDGIDRLQ